MQRFRWVRGVVVLGLAGALVGAVPDGVSAAPARKECRATAFVTNALSASVSTIDVKTRTKNPTDIPVGTGPYDVGVTPDGMTAFVTYNLGDSVSTIDVKSRTKHPTDIAVGTGPKGVTVTPDGKTAFVMNGGVLAGPAGVIGPIRPVGDSVSTIDVKTRTKHPTDITVPPGPIGVAVTPDGKTAFVKTAVGVSMIDVKTRTKHPTDITAGVGGGVAFTPDGKTAFVTDPASGTVSTIDVKTRTKHPTDIPVGTFPFQVAVTPCRR